MSISRFATNTVVGLRPRGIHIEVRSRCWVTAETAAYLIAALGSASCSIGAPDVWYAGSEGDHAVFMIHGSETNSARWTRHALAGVILDARRLTRQALANRGNANCTSRRAFGGDARKALDGVRAALEVV